MPTHDLTIERSHAIVKAVAPGHELTAVKPVLGGFTNYSRILECRTPAGSCLRLVVKLLTDDPDPARASADYHGLRIAREHGIPAPEPLLLDETGSVLGMPGIVTAFVEGGQIASPRDPATWAETLARILVRIHDVSVGARDREHIFDGNDLGLYFLRGDWPEKMAGHPLSSEIYGAVEELRHTIAESPAVFVHMDYWPGNVLWHHDRVSAVLDWDAAGYGDRALDVAYFRMNMYLRGIKSAADVFLDCYEAECGPVSNLGFWELATAAEPCRLDTGVPRDGRFRSHGRPGRHGLLRVRQWSETAGIQRALTRTASYFFFPFDLPGGAPLPFPLPGGGPLTFRLPLACSAPTRSFLLRPGGSHPALFFACPGGTNPPPFPVSDDDPFPPAVLAAATAGSSSS